jgi:hypothetical protein
MTGHAGLLVVIVYSDDVSVTSEQPTTAHVRLFVVLVSSDDVSVTLVHRTTSHAHSS